METSQLIFRANQLTGFYMMGTLVVKELKICTYHLVICGEIGLLIFSGFFSIFFFYQGILSQTLTIQWAARGKEVMQGEGS